MAIVASVQMEILAALPELVKQSPVVVKEVFGRLLGIHHGAWYCSLLVLYVILTLIRPRSRKESNNSTRANGSNAQY